MKKVKITKLIRKTHLYLGLVFAPLIILFALSGFFIVNGLDKSNKDGSYTTPEFIQYTTRVHKYISRCIFKDSKSYEKMLNSEELQDNCYIFKYSVIAMSIGLVITILMGIFLAFKYSRNKIILSACLLIGCALPTIILVL